jgi:hypothetical protein
MTIDYTPFLHVLEDGSIWWRLEDAIKLGAGYVPTRDDARNLNSALTAANNQVCANERALYGALNGNTPDVVQPRILQREDGLLSLKPDSKA